MRLLEVYNPNEQKRFACYPERCVTDKAPTLATVRAEYGSHTALSWLVIQLNDYNSFVGVKEENKNSVGVMSEVAQMIINRYPYLNLAEVMLFFQRMKYGDYGEMYGSVDAVRILRALKSFMAYRNDIITDVEHEMRRLAIAEAKENAITFDEYKRRKDAASGDILPNE